MKERIDSLLHLFIVSLFIDSMNRSIDE